MPYNLSGSPLDIDQAPQLHDGTLWVPLRAISSALGGNVDWEPTNGVAILYLNSHIVTVKIGDAAIDVDGTKTALRSAPYVEEGETWVPVRLFSETLGYSLDVDLESKSVNFIAPTA